MRKACGTCQWSWEGKGGRIKPSLLAATHCLMKLSTTWNCASRELGWIGGILEKNNLKPLAMRSRTVWFWSISTKDRNVLWCFCEELSLWINKNLPISGYNFFFSSQILTNVWPAHQFSSHCLSVEADPGMHLQQLFLNFLKMSLLMVNVNSFQLYSGWSTSSYNTQRPVCSPLLHLPHSLLFSCNSCSDRPSPFNSCAIFFS